MTNDWWYEPSGSTTRPQQVSSLPPRSPVRTTRVCRYSLDLLTEKGRTGLDTNGKDSGMPRQPKAIVLAVVMALLMALALVGTASAAAGDTSGESAGDLTGSSQTTLSQSSDDSASSGEPSGATAEDSGSNQTTPSQSSDDSASSGESSGKTSTTPRELPTTGSGGYLQQQAPVDLHEFALLGLAFAGLALVAVSLAVRRATR